MQQISISIPDTRLGFMLELLQNFDFVKIENTDGVNTIELTDEQKKSLDKERKLAEQNKDYMLDWDEVKDKLILD